MTSMSKELTLAALASTAEGTLLLLLSASAKARKAKEKPPSLALQLSGLASRSDASSSKAPAEPLEAPSKRSLKKAQPLSHRLLRNLASLTYHHLSPHTLMRTRRNNFVGGTASGAARRARARTDAGEPFASLRVTPKPRFGPLLHNRLRRSAWSPVPGEVPALQAASDACHATWKEAKLAGKNEQYVERLWRNFVEERGKLKTAKGRIEKEERKRELQEAPRRLLGGLARCLAERNEFWIGGRRWEKFRKGEWLD